MTSTTAPFRFLYFFKTRTNKESVNLLVQHKICVIKINVITSSTFAAVLAEVSMKIKPCSLAKASPSSFFTSLLASRSLFNVYIYLLFLFIIFKKTARMIILHIYLFDINTCIRIYLFFLNGDPAPLLMYRGKPCS